MKIKQKKSLFRILVMLRKMQDITENERKKLK